jgi:glycosyltransferase involved in cell wall biosynthesis
VLREKFRLIAVPYVTFPGAGKRGTTVLDRSTAYPLFGWRAGREAVKLARRGDVDIVHALGASGLGYALARQRHEPTKPFVFNPQGLEEFGATDPRRARLKRAAYAPLQVAVRACAKAADVVIATDRALVPTVLKHLPIDASRVEVIPNAIDLTTIDQRRRDRARVAADAAAMRARFGIDAATPVILSVGRLEENKGFHVAARALGDLLRREASRPKAASTLMAMPTSHWRWVLVGDGPYRATIERIAAAEGLGSRMIVTGRVSDDELHAWYETAALFVHPTLYEGSSLVTLEAMAHERAVIATRAGGLPDKVHPGVNGWLVEPDRADLLTDALADALRRDPADLARFGRASRDIVEREFAWPVVAARMMDVYHNLLMRSR